MNVIRDCRHGKMMFGDLDTYVGRSLDLYGEYSEVEAAILAKAAGEGGVAVEAGANIGSLTVPLAKAVGPSGLVYAFEPQRATFFALCGNLFVNNIKNVFCFQRALGEVPGVATIPDIDYDFSGNYGAFSLAGPTTFDKIPNKLPVEVNPLDAFGVPACSMLKVDVEGMELAVLRGAAGTIRRCRPVLYVEEDRDEGRDELIAWIRGEGYECWHHFPPLYSPDNFRGNPDNVFGPCMSANILAFHPSSGLTRDSFADFALVPIDVKIRINSLNN